MPSDGALGQHQWLRLQLVSESVGRLVGTLRRMNRRDFLATLSVSVLAAPLAAEAQQLAKVYRIGYLTVPSRATAGGVADTFERTLRDLGWIAGQNVTIDYRFADSDVSRLPELAAELVRLRADVIVSGANAAVAAVKKETSTTPIVMFLAIDPVASGLVASLARPGGNVTGLTATVGPEITASSCSY